MLVETGLAEAVVTVVTIADGTVSLYTSTGGPLAAESRAYPGTPPALR